MLPDYDEFGCLSPGIHRATLAEITLRFNHTSYRTRGGLTTALEYYVKEVQHLGPVGLYIDGSYITQKLAPSDVDIGLVLPEGYDIEGHKFLYRNPRFTRMKLDIHLFGVGWNDEVTANFLANWQVDLQTGRPKGIVYLEF